MIVSNVFQHENATTRRYDFTLRTPGTFPVGHTYSYPIFVQQQPDWPAFVRRLTAIEADHFTLVADASLPESVIASFSDHLQQTGVPCLLIRLEAREQTKTMETALSLVAHIRAHGGGTHASCLVSLGGGLVGNIVGFAATLLVRGIALIHIPTTLLAATDSILSLKQGVNVRTADGLLVKNLLGAFYAPCCVLVYLSLWDTLPRQEIRAGLCELVKNVVGIHPERYTEVAALLRPEANYTPNECQRIFELCFAAKHAVMREDAHEKGPALILELGHTFGHALEAHTGLSHGLAVGLGLRVAARISVARGQLRAAEEARITTLLERVGAPTTLPANLEVEAILALMRLDNKAGYLPARPGHHVMVLLEHLGQPVISQGLPLTYVSEEEVRAAITAIQSPAGTALPFLQKGVTHVH